MYRYLHVWPPGVLLRMHGPDARGDDALQSEDGSTDQELVGRSEHTQHHREAGLLRQPAGVRPLSPRRLGDLGARYLGLFG